MADLEAVFDNANPSQLEGSFQKFGDSLKKIGEQIKEGINKLQNDPNIPKINWPKPTNINMSGINAVFDNVKTKLKPVGESLDKVVESVPNVVEVNDAAQVPIAKVKDAFGKAVTGASQTAQEGAEAVNDVATNGDQHIQDSEERQLLEFLKDIRANRAARYTKKEVEPEDKPKDDTLQSVLKEFKNINKSLSPEHTKQAFDDMKKAIGNMKSSFESMIHQMKGQFESSKKPRTSRTRRGLKLSTNNVTAFIDTINEAFENKELNGAFQDMLTAVNDIGDQMQSSFYHLNKGMNKLIAKYNTSNDKRSRRSASARPESHDMRKMREAIEKVKITFDPDRIKAAFGAVTDAMDNLENEMSEGFEEFADILQSEESQNKREIQNPVQEIHPQEKVDHEVANQTPDKTSEKIIDGFTVIFGQLKPEDIEKAFVLVGEKIDNISRIFQLSVDKLKKNMKNEIQTKAKRIVPETEDQDVITHVNNPESAIGEMDKEVTKATELSNQALQGLHQAVKAADSVAKDGLHAGADAKSKLSNLVDKAKGDLEDEIRKSGVASTKAWESFENAIKSSHLTPKEVDHQVRSVIKGILHKSKERAEEAGKQRSKRQAAGSDKNTKDNINEIVKIFDNISGSLQPQNIKAYNSLMKNLFTNLESLLEAAYKELLKCIHDIEPKENSGDATNIAKRKADVNNEIVTNFFVVNQNSFNQMKLVQDFEVMMKQLQETIKAMLNATTKLRGTRRLNSNIKLDENRMLGQNVEEDRAAYTQLKNILEKVMLTVNPDHIIGEFKKLNDKVKQAKGDMKAALKDFRKWALHLDEAPKSTRDLEEPSENKDLPSTKNIIEKIDKLIANLNPEDIEKAFTRLGEEIEGLEKEIEKGVKKLKNGIHRGVTVLKETVTNMSDTISKTEKVVKDEGEKIDKIAGEAITDAKEAADHLSSSAEEPTPKSKRGEGETKASKGTFKIKDIISKIKEFIGKLAPKEQEKEFARMHEHLRNIKATTSILAGQSKFSSRTIGEKDEADDIMTKLKEVLDVDNMEDHISKVQGALSETATLFLNELHKAQETLKALITDIIAEDTGSENKRQLQKDDLIKEILDKMETAFKKSKFEDRIKELDRKIEDIERTLRDGINDFIKAIDEKTNKPSTVNKKRDMNEGSETEKNSPGKLINVIEGLYDDLDPEDINKAFTDLGNQIKTFANQIRKGFETLKKDATLKDPVENKQTKKERALVEEIRKALVQAKAKREESDVGGVANTDVTASKLLHNFDQMKEHLGDIQKLMDPKALDSIFYQLSKGLHDLNIKFEAVLKEIKIQLINMTNIKERSRRTNDDQVLEGTVEKLIKSFNQTALTKQFVRIWDAMINAAEKLQKGISKSSQSLNKVKLNEETIKRSLLDPNTDRSTEEDSRLSKMVDEIKETFDRDNIRKEFDRLNKEIQNAESELNNGIKEFEQWVEKMGEKSKPVSEREVPPVAKKNKGPSVEEVIGHIVIVLKDLNPNDVRQAFADAWNKIKEIREIFKSGIRKIKTDLANDKHQPPSNVKRSELTEELLGEIFRILNATKPRKTRDVGDQDVPTEDNDVKHIMDEFSDVEKELDPKNVQKAFENIIGRLKVLMADFLEGFDQLSSTASAAGGKRDVASEDPKQSIANRIKDAFDTDKITEAFNDAIKAMQSAEGKVEGIVRTTGKDVKALLNKQEEVKRALEGSNQRSTLEDNPRDEVEKIYKELMAALELVKSSLSPEAIKKAFDQLNEEVGEAEGDLNEWLKKVESWILGKMHHPGDPADSQIPSTEDRQRREAVKSNTEPNDPKVDLNKVIEAVSPENMEKLNKLTELVFGEAEHLANTMKDFGAKLRMPLPGVKKISLPKMP